MSTKKLNLKDNYTDQLLTDDYLDKTSIQQMDSLTRLLKIKELYKQFRDISTRPDRNRPGIYIKKEYGSFLKFIKTMQEITFIDIIQDNNNSSETASRLYKEYNLLTEILQLSMIPSNPLRSPEEEHILDNFEVV